MKIKNTLIFLLLFYLAITCQAQLDRHLLLSPFGARPLGMGTAFTAVADDGSAVFYNPAGLAGDGMQILFIDQDTSHEYLQQDYSRVVNLGSFTYFDRAVKTGTSSGELYGLSLAIGTRKGINWGISSKSLSLPGESAHAIDVGVQLFLNREWTAGIMFQNIVSEDIDFDPSYRLGLAYRFQNLLAAVDLVYKEDLAGDAEIKAAYGLEYYFVRGFALRTGYTNDQDFTWGVSLALPVVILEYAVIYDNDNPFYCFNLKLGLDKTEVKKGKRLRAIYKDREYVELILNGPLTSGASSYSVVNGLVVGTDEVLRYIRWAREDKDVEGMIIKMGSYSGSVGAVGFIQELREEFKKFKKSGKRIIVYLRGDGTNNTYYLASVADEIVMAPGGTVGFLGKNLTVQRLTKLFEKLGIRWEVLTQGEYKGSTNPFSNPLTEKQEIALRQLVNDVYQEMIDDIKADRNLTSPNLKLLAEGQLITTKKALALGLIDSVGYYSDAVKKIDSEIDIDDERKFRHKVIPITYLKDDYAEGNISYFLPFNKKIAVIPIDGEIVSGKSRQDFIFGSKYVGSETVVSQISKAISDDQVKVIIVRINSPGGSAIASEEIYHKLIEAKEKDKIIIASIGNIAASGGYYIAAAADTIIANTGSLTGSIGVISQFPIFADFNQALGIENKSISTGKHMDMFSGNRSITVEEREMIQAMMKNTYDEFLEKVAEARKMDKFKVEKVAGGRIFSGRQAQRNNLIDKIGNFSDAIALAKKQAKIVGEVQIIQYEEKPDGLMQQAREMVKSFFGFGDEGILPALDAKINQMEFVY